MNKIDSHKLLLDFLNSTAVSRDDLVLFRTGGVKYMIALGGREEECYWLREQYYLHQRGKKYAKARQKFYDRTGIDAGAYHEVNKYDTGGRAIHILGCTDDEREAPVATTSVILGDPSLDHWGLPSLEDLRHFGYKPQDLLPKDLFNYWTKGGHERGMDPSLSLIHI